MGIHSNTSLLPNEANANHERTNALLQEWVAKHRTLNEIFLDAYCVVDLANRVVDFNVAFTELCGESYRKILKIGDFCELLKTEICPHQCPSLQITQSQKSLRLDELTGSTKAFPQLNIILGGVPIFSSKNEIIGSLITIRNVSAESELQKKYDERKKESITDGLTRLYNKVYTEDSLLKLLKISSRETVSLSVIMCDIDHFKKVNDTYGHQAGDYVLYTVAQLLKGESRESDIVGRFGGEEFIVVLANTDLPGSKVFSERFRNRVSKTKILFEGKHIPVTISIGTATLAETWKPGVSAERVLKELVNSADTALYYAKAHGRNQTCQFETLPADYREHKG